MRLAEPSDDELLRRLMRENGMPSWVEMSLEREPSYFAAKQWSASEWTVIAEENESVVGMYSAAAQGLYLGGVESKVGYLGALRVESSQRHRIKHIRRGFNSIRELIPDVAALPRWYTVIAEENLPARRLLEAGLPGLPRYRQIGKLTTYAVARRRGKRLGLWRRAHAVDKASIIELHHACARRLDLAPTLDECLISRLGIDSFYLLESAGKAIACCAFWDQSGFKQIVAKNYHPVIRAGRPIYNAFAALTARVPLPAIGTQLPQSFIAFAAFSDEATKDPEFAALHLSDLVSHCPTRVAAIGLHDSNPVVDAVRKLSPLTYSARIYSVEFDGQLEPCTHPVQPEVATL